MKGGITSGVVYPHARALWVALAGCRFWLTAMIGALPGLALAVLAVVDGGGALEAIAIIAGALLALVGPSPDARAAAPTGGGGSARQAQGRRCLI